MGLDNPDTLYLHAYLRDDAEYIVTGQRGSTIDLSFQVLNGDYSPAEVPDSLTAFDDRASRSRRRLVRGPFRARRGRGPAVTTSPWRRLGDARGARGVQRLGQRAARHDAHPAGPTGRRAPPPDDGAAGEAIRRRGQDPAVPPPDVPRLPRVVLPEGAGQHDDSAPADTRRTGDPVLLGRAFRPRPRPGDDRHRAAAGRESRPTRAFSSAACGTSRWTTSTTRPASPPTRRGRTRTAGSVRDQRARPGVANWLELTGRTRGYVQIRWQRLSRDLRPRTGRRSRWSRSPTCPDVLPYYEQARMPPEDGGRIAARQAAVAERMLG